ncbi:MAG TPA: divalent-cation tolerance protein CutA [Candidatus Omnitrophota bacterium]|nr:divalent-cation tolerance protein CutA [Candidatus Omnitrophota bacterium]HRZ15479.1 divalent-cation tolerance protein CutA [Candidatus Omnitrophota bacterium]
MAEKKHVIIFITVAGVKQANGIAEALVRQRLAACVNIVKGVTSVFRWQGKIDRAQEVLLIVKTTAARMEPLMRCVRTLHSYEVPEIIAVPIVAGHQPYLEWINASVGKPA